MGERPKKILTRAGYAVLVIKSTGPNVKDIRHTIALTRFRLSNHNLQRKEDILDQKLNEVKENVSYVKMRLKM